MNPLTLFRTRLLNPLNLFMDETTTLLEAEENPKKIKVGQRLDGVRYHTEEKAVQKSDGFAVPARKDTLEGHANDGVVLADLASAFEAYAPLTASLLSNGGWESTLCT